MVDGYFLLHRKVLKSDIGKDPMTWFVFCHLLARANYEPTTIRWEGKVATLPRGALLFSYRQMAEDLGLSHNTLKHHIDLLCERKTIKIETSSGGSKVFFYKYSQYQENQIEVCQPVTRGVPASVSATDTEACQPQTHIYNQKKQEAAGRAEKSQAALVRPSSLDHLLELLGKEYCLHLAQTFPDPEYLKLEMQKLFMWFKDEPRKGLKSPAGWRRTVTSWMSRGWERRTKSQPKSKPHQPRFANV